MGRGAAILGDDPLAARTAELLRCRGVDVVEAGAAELADLTVTVGPESVEAGGVEIGAIVLRTPPGATPAARFTERDRSFAASEVSAAWLAACHAPSVLAVNRLDAEGWFEGPHWPVWRRRLRDAGVELSPLSIGAAASGSHWRPYTGRFDRAAPAEPVRRALGTALADGPLTGITLFADGRAAAGGAPEPAARAARLLRDHGLWLVSVAHDSEARVAAIDPFPFVSPDLVDDIAARLAAHVHDHLRSR